jgi:AraC-like DNA-binding protein
MRHVNHYAKQNTASKWDAIFECKISGEMKQVILNKSAVIASEKKLYSIVTGYFVVPQHDVEKHKDSVCKYVNAYRGTVLQFNARTFVMLFESSSKAVYCSFNIMKLYNALQVQLNIGLNIKECYPEEITNEKGTNTVLDLLKTLAPNQILASQIVKTVVLAPHFNFIPYSATFIDKDEMPTLFYVIVKQQSETLLSKRKIDKNRSPEQILLLSKVTQTIAHHFCNEHFGVKTLCEEIGISERQLQRKLKVLVRMTPSQYITLTRLKQAKKLLENSSLSIAEIAFKTGFSNPSYFSKCFKKTFHYSPSSYKKLR